VKKTKAFSHGRDNKRQNTRSEKKNTQDTNTVAKLVVNEEIVGSGRFTGRLLVPGLERKEEANV
jgi:hypothetical protein